MAEADGRPSGAVTATVTAAAVLLAVKAVLGVWAAAVLFAASRRHHRRFLGTVVRQPHAALAVVLLAFVVATVVVVIGLEGLAIVLALTRVGSRPGAVLISIAFSIAIIGLLSTRSAFNALSDHG